MIFKLLVLLYISFVSAQTCPATALQSCSRNLGNVDKCCTNTDSFLQTQFWDAGTGPVDSFTIHGLWLDHCHDSGFPSFCDKSRNVADVAGVLQNSQDPNAQTTLDYMNTYWKDSRGNDNTFFSHEWNKHGSCVSTLDPSCYGDSYIPQQEVVTFFETTVNLFQTLPTYQWLEAAGITPSKDQTYNLADLQAVAQSNHGFDAVWNCKNGALDEVWWNFVTTGSFAAGNFQFIPSAPLSTSTCPE